VWAIINNETQTGITAHLIDDGCDTGNIVLQHKIDIHPDDTGASVLEKYNIVYPEMVEQVLYEIEKEKLIASPQNNEAATYFGKRTPDDGQIDWNWQKERIKNWVRAQAHPYPGAFTFYKGQKVTIDKIEFADAGFHADMQNGLILSVEPLIVKTPNGAIVVKAYRENLLIETGEIFN